MDDDMQQLLENFRSQSQTASTDNEEATTDLEVLEVPFYPEDQGDNVTDEDESEIEALVQAARQQMITQGQQEGAPIGYVSNARNAKSYSDTFQFWAPAEETSLGIGSIIRHTSYGQQLFTSMNKMRTLLLRAFFLPPVPGVPSSTIARRFLHPLI